MRRRLSLSGRIVAGALVMAAVFSVSSLVAVQALQGARRDLVVLTRGYLALGRTATTLQTLQEVHDHNMTRAVMEPDRLRRAELSAFARELYPESMGERLAELQALSRQLQQSGVATTDALFLENVFAKANRAKALALAYDDETDALLEALDDDDGRDDAGQPVDRAAVIEQWRKRSEQASRELRTIALGVDTRAADALIRIEDAEAKSIRVVVVAAVIAVVLAALILWMMMRALVPLRSLARVTRAMQEGATAVSVGEALASARASGERGDTEIAALADELMSLSRSLEERGAALMRRTDELARLTAFAENVIRSVRVGIVVVDDKGIIKRINPAARSVFSLPLQDVEEHPLSHSQSAFGAAAAVVDEVRQTGESRALPALKLAEKVVDVMVVPLRDRSGARSGEVLVLGDDVTAREDARERLVHSERLAAIGRLAAQITHEIRNPLSSIGLNIELLGDDVPLLPKDRQHEVQSILAAVLTEVRRLAEITEGYLRFARLPTAPKQVRDVADLCADLVAFVQGEAAARGVNLELHVPSEGALPAVVVDGDRLRQALLNLVRNGIDACGHNGTVRLVVKTAADSGLDVVVSDNGPGVDPEKRARLFSPFFTTKKDGTGLGLVVAREIVREHGGELTVTDAELGGAAFTVHLPAPSTTGQMEQTEARG
jgi:signal transduction histidine kinase